MAYGTGKVVVGASLRAYPKAVPRRRSGGGPVSGYARPGRLSRRQQQQLGILPVIATSAISLVGKLTGGLFGDAKDPQRLAQNTAWYQAAVAGDRTALQHLADMSGISPPGASGSGWATTTAQADAANKYNQAVSVLNGKAGVSTTPSGTALPAGWVPNWDGSGTYVFLGSPGTGNVGTSPGVFTWNPDQYDAMHPGWKAQLTAKLSGASGPGSALIPVPPATQATTSDLADVFSSFFTGFTSTPGGQQAVQTVTPSLVSAGKQQAATKIGSAIVNNPALVAGLLVGGLALAASLGRKSR